MENFTRKNPRDLDHGDRVIFRDALFTKPMTVDYTRFEKTARGTRVVVYFVEGGMRSFAKKATVRVTK